MGLVAAGRASRTALLAGVLIAGVMFAGAPGASARERVVMTHVDSSACSQPALTQSFLPYGDFNYYAPVPGPAATAFDGSSWTLTGGAGIASTQLAGGSTGQVLNLPAGSHAVSPDMCIKPGQNPLSRAIVRNLGGGGGVQVSVSYYSSGAWGKLQGAGGVNAGPGGSWTASNTIKIPPGPPPPPGVSPGWLLVRFTFTAPAGGPHFQMYGLGVAAPPPTPSTGACSNPVFSQAFLPVGDTHYYTPAPGQTGGGFVGTGWTLTGGAKIETASRANGTSGYVLDLPAGSMAVSPNICVTSLYPTARMMIRSVFGGDDLSFRVSYANTGSWTHPHETGHVQGNGTGWTLSAPVQLQPSPGPGWQIVRLTLVPDGPQSQFQIYDLELDPYAKG